MGAICWGIAQTGTGKTAAFAIPILQHLSSGMQAERPTCRAATGGGGIMVGNTDVRPIRALILTPYPGSWPCRSATVFRITENMSV